MPATRMHGRMINSLARASSNGSTSSGRKKKRWPGFPSAPRSLSGIVVDRHRQVDPVFKVLFDRRDRGDLSFECHVENVGVGKRPEPHAIAHGIVDSDHANGLEPGWFESRVPVTHVGDPPAGAGARGTYRAGPAIVLLPSDSVRARTARARSSTAAIAAFSSSVRVMIRSVRISSISVPSKSSPGLSGAIWG